MQTANAIAHLQSHTHTASYDHHKFEILAKPVIMRRSGFESKGTCAEVVT